MDFSAISFTGICQGIIWTSGTQWATQRRFSLRTLKDFGFGKDRIEDSIHFEVSVNFRAQPVLGSYLKLENEHLKRATIQRQSTITGLQIEEMLLHLKAVAMLTIHVHLYF